jgi:hypothetical protein
MYGLLLDCLEKFIVAAHGKDVWVSVLQNIRGTSTHESGSKTTNVICVGDDVNHDDNYRVHDRFFIPAQPDEEWMMNKNYPDELFFKICILAAVECDLEVENVIENTGRFFLDYIS